MFLSFDWPVEVLLVHLLTLHLIEWLKVCKTTMCMTHLVHGGFKCNLLQMSVRTGKCLSPYHFTEHLTLCEVRALRLKFGNRKKTARERGTRHDIFMWCFFSKTTSSNSYFGLKSLPALRDNGIVLSVLNSNYYFIYSCGAFQTPLPELPMKPWEISTKQKKFFYI